MSRLTRNLLGLAAGLVSGAALAAAPDVTGVVTSIGDVMTPVSAIGAAVLTLFVGIKTFKWVRRAM
jgi:coat protein B